MRCQIVSISIPLISKLAHPWPNRGDEGAKVVGHTKEWLKVVSEAKVASLRLTTEAEPVVLIFAIR